MKPAFVVVDVEVKDPATYAEYRTKAPATLQRHGGRYVVRGGDITHVEPGWTLTRFVILQFPSVQAARAWYESPEYQAILPIRLKSTKSRLMIVEGLDPTAPLPA